MYRVPALALLVLGWAAATAALGWSGLLGGRLASAPPPTVDTTTAPPPVLSEDERVNIDLYKRAGPGVVYLSSVALEWDYFYNVVPQQGSGSGFIVDARGVLLTNYHVVAKAQRIEVLLHDGSRHEARVVGADPSNDVAVLKIHAPGKKLQPLPFGESGTLQVGQKVLAIGNPFGLARTLTVGVVSSLGRDLRAPNNRIIKGVIQTDAAINPGNSGGPLLDAAGRVVGINSAIFSPSGGSVGIGFAVPIDRIRKMLPDLVSLGHPRHAWLGVQMMPFNAQIATALGLPARSGALVESVSPGSPAALAGLRGGYRRFRYGNLILNLGGDLIVGVDGQKLEDADGLIEILDGRAPGDRVQLEVLKVDGAKVTVDVVLGERPEGED